MGVSGGGREMIGMRIGSVGYKVGIGGRSGIGRQRRGRVAKERRERVSLRGKIERSLFINLWCSEAVISFEVKR